MAKKLQGNGLWESSRIILPEHKEEIQAWRQRREQRSRPELDEQEWERIDTAISWSLRTGEPVRVRLYDSNEDQIITGTVERVDRVLRRVRIGREWVSMDDIMGVDAPGE